MSCGTHWHGATELENQGLTGQCTQRLSRRSGTELEATFSSLQLMHTSRTSGNRLFHLVVSVAVQGSQGPQQPLASISSPAFHVDARKRSQVERPDSSTSDVRLVARSECKRLKPQ